MSSMIDITPGAACAHGDGPSCGLDPGVSYRGEINDQSIIANSQASRIMSAAADRKK